MSWETVTPGKRWEWTADDERHLLVLVGTELREMHEVPGGAVTVHVYEPDDLHEGRSASLAEPELIVAPLAEATHVATHVIPEEFGAWVRTLDDREAFEWLEAFEAPQP